MGEIIDTPLTKVRGIGQKRAQQFAEIGIETVLDLLYYSPREYIDYSDVKPISALRPGKVTIEARLDAPPKTWRKGRRHFTQAVFSDDSGKVKAMWYNQPYRARQLKLGQDYMISGDLSFYGRQYALQHPSVERVESERLSTGVVVARYPAKQGLTSRMILSAQKRALDLLPDDFEIYPEDFVNELDMTPLKQAIEWLHFPDNRQQQSAANQRLSFDEIFALQLSARIEKQKLAEQPAEPIKFNQELAKTFVDKLDFKLTDAQRLSAWDILRDIDSKVPMNRLLEGDVGSGKTIVSAMALLMAADNNYQAAYLAPTTILAEQQYTSLKQIFSEHKLRVALLNRHTKTAKRKQILNELKSGKIDILVGTHAITSEKVEFKNLNMIVVDEQHRFGVEQRQRLIGKTDTLPHVLTMTATPIPRSLALTLYGELDISIIDYKPADRQPISTKLLAYSARTEAYKLAAAELDNGNQVYVVAPRIEKDDQLLSVEQLEEELPRKLLKGFSYAVLHGKMKADEKDQIMADFNSGKVQFLISTTVVEVGLDNPNATVMIIEGADRYGLAQLHQLRGRVGRSDKQSYCFLITTASSEPSRRLRAMETADDGFELSELDLEIRGPGALYGLRQHGPLDLNLADITDYQLIKQVKQAVDVFINKQYNLSSLKLLKRRVESMRSTTFLN